MRNIRTVAAIAGLGAVAGCAQVIENKENMLAAAGFGYRPADTPQLVASLHSIPPHKFVQVTRNGKLLWVYADPTICGCLYVGNEAAYDTYRHEVFEKNIADEQQMAASMNENAAVAASMNWGLWAGPWMPYGYYP
jgi:hypothetical protein